MPRTSSLITTRVGKAERLLAEAAAAHRGVPLSRFAGRAIRDAAIEQFTRQPNGQGKAHTTEGESK